MKTVLAILASTPAKFRREVAAMSPQEVRKKPAPGKWSVQQILAHLEDIEGPGFRGRVEAILQKDHPLLPSFDQEARAVAERYDRKNPQRSLTSWMRKRRENLRWLRRLRPVHLKRKARHATVGEVSVEDFLHEWAFHDLGHLKQILEIKRYALYPRMGNMRAFYRLS